MQHSLCLLVGRFFGLSVCVSVRLSVFVDQSVGEGWVVGRVGGACSDKGDKHLKICVYICVYYVLLKTLPKSFPVAVFLAQEISKCIRNERPMATERIGKSRETSEPSMQTDPPLVPSFFLGTLRAANLLNVHLHTLIDSRLPGQAWKEHLHVEG